MLMHNPSHPGEILRQLCLEPLDLSVTEAAKALGISHKTLSSILNGRTGISPEMAIRLSMTCRKLRYAGLGAVLAGALSACAWGGSSTATEPAKPDASLVEMISGGLLLARTGKPELGLTLANNSERTLWAQVRFRTPNGQHDCLLSKELEPESKGDYLCAQPAIQADSDYPLQIVVFGDRVQTQVLERLNTRFRFSREDVQAVGGK